MSTLIKQQANHNMTPMMEQYLKIKQDHADCLLFYRLGDFYELFFEDAIEAAKILDIALTKRGKQEGQDIPMCGVPFHSSDNYIYKLIKQGYKVAICEQLETPEEAKKRGYKSVVNRAVVRIITPGTITEDNLLISKEPNYLMALYGNKEDLSLAWIDISTGEFTVSSTNIINLSYEISKINPKEIILADKLLSDEEFYNILQDWKNILTTHVASFFDYNRGEKNLLNFYGIISLEGVISLSKNEVSTCGSIIEYINLTQKHSKPKVSYPKRIDCSQFMIIDQATKKNLEIFCQLSGEHKASLINIIDQTLTSGGGRMLFKYLSYPLVDPAQINSRLDLVEFFYNNNQLRQEIREILKKVPDLARSLSRLSMKRGGPKDLLNIKISLIEASNIFKILSDIKNKPGALNNILAHLNGYNELINQLMQALQDEVGLLVRDGNFINYGYNQKLDQFISLQQNSKIEINKLRDKYRVITGVNNLKIEQNNIFGYYIEVTPQHLTKMQSTIFQHKQTLASAVRYITDELKELEINLINCRDAILKLEIEIFDELVGLIINKYDNLLISAESLSYLDVILSLAELAKTQNYIKPVIDDSKEFNLIKARHPVVEKIHSNFIPNNCNLSNKQRLWLITGPNMAGKSTFLRQNAIIAILAQIGSFVPAEYAHIGIIDRLFSRVGASDDLAKGHSTFMVEMIETATILNQATDRSLVILDELGRGTATFDGLSIAWSCVEYIHDKIASRTLFATHYHELSQLQNQLNSLVCYSMKVKEWEGKIIFLHEIEEGTKNKSYGIHVAQLAGLPRAVIRRANIILQNLESDKVKVHYAPLFNYIEEKEVDQLTQRQTEIIEILTKVNGEELTPKQSLDLIFKLQNMLKD